MSKNIIRAIKLLVSVGLIAYLIYTVDWARAITELRGVNRYLVFLAALIFMFNTVVTSAWKWQISLRIHGLPWRFPGLSKILLIGLFLNNFLPSAIGGDIYRVYRTMPQGGQKSRAVSAVLLDRVMGLLSLFVVGALGALMLYLANRDPRFGLLTLVLAAPPLAAAIFPFVFRLSLFRPLFKKLGRVKKLDPLVANTRLIFGDKQGVARLAAVSLLFHILAVTAIALLFAAAHAPGLWAESAVADTTYATVALLPISINGLGVQEGSFAFTAQQLGISFSHAVIVALALRLIALLTSLIGGGLVFLFDKGRSADLDLATETIKRSPH
ncbi:lysylphosphatidylglycerol synthase transmembrane domain-containing protein [Salinisphaera aquimarina]|uniref:Lysylphosphatidylglycerol synthase transmembrane domain-containing protein n=2 Tax=Salinisphaera aquimarina TaxID=2094031 RepID=A0ABV7ESG5_9GAMM